MKTAFIVLLLATTIVSPSNAGSWIKVEQPCGSKCVAPPPAASRSVPAWSVVGGVRFRELNESNTSRPIMVGATDPTVYISRSRTVISSAYGTSVINRTYRSYLQ